MGIWIAAGTTNDQTMRKVVHQSCRLRFKTKNTFFRCKSISDQNILHQLICWRKQAIVDCRIIFTLNPFSTRYQVRRINITDCLASPFVIWWMNDSWLLQPVDTLGPSLVILQQSSIILACIVDGLLKLVPFISCWAIRPLTAVLQIIGGWLKRLLFRSFDLVSSSQNRTGRLRLAHRWERRPRHLPDEYHALDSGHHRRYQPQRDVFWQQNKTCLSKVKTARLNTNTVLNVCLLYEMVGISK